MTTRACVNLLKIGYFFKKNLITRHYVRKSPKSNPAQKIVLLEDQEILIRNGVNILGSDLNQILNIKIKFYQEI